MRLKTLIGITILLLGIGTATAQPQEKKKKDTYKASVYLFGFSASFNDSIVYFTDIQKVDNVLLEKKTNFLLSRDQYSYQLRDFLANQKGQPNRTCITMFATSRKNAEKEYLNLQQLYTAKAKGKYDVRMLATDFVYVRVEEDE